MLFVRSSTRILVLAAGLLASTAVGCFDSEAVKLGESDVVRLPDGRIQVDLELKASEQGGGAVGSYCVYAYWFPLGVDLAFVPTARSYWALQDVASFCSGPGEVLEEGDIRMLRLISRRNDLVARSPLRLQVSADEIFDSQDEIIP